MSFDNHIANKISSFERMIESAILRLLVSVDLDGYSTTTTVFKQCGVIPDAEIPGFR